MSLEMNRRHLLALGGAAASVPLLAGCLDNDLPGQTPEGSREISVGASDEPQVLDPVANAQAAIPQVLLYNVYETLVKVDNNGELRGLLASAWTISEDRLTYRFTLHEATTFASGTPLDAAAVVASIEFLRAAKSPNTSVARAMDQIESVTAEGALTVIVKLTAPSLLWLYDMTSTGGIIVDPAGHETMADAPMGSGPYVFDSHQRGTSITLKRNEKYWGTPQRVDTIVFRYFTDPNAMNSAMLAGDLDVISNLAAPQALDQFADERYTVLEGFTTGEVVLGFNHTNPALAKKQVRQAINHAIDRQGLVDTVWGGKGQMIGSMVPPSDPWYEDLSETYPFDPAKAKQLLADAGHATGLTLKLRVPTLPYGPGAATVIKSQLNDVGITVTVEEIDFTRWINEVFVNAQYDMTIVAHVEARDIVNWANKGYYWKYDNPDFQRLIAEAAAAEQTKAYELMKQAAKLLSDDAVADFLFLLPSLVVTKSTVSGIGNNAPSLSFDLTSVATRSS
ncbi:ABC transporter substrate-binding protein [Tessaracoccus sp. SD287]|uniref:ABC transporter substrate-binding protein n=1 Tax=Tessaracoccus sp. SD287 TaxID=2782008 RepID=UPI001F622D6E|nr:ABC transporter substrate-binding protein [Tessaracoccus sp. SD287]